MATFLEFTSGYELIPNPVELFGNQVLPYHHPSLRRHKAGFVADLAKTFRFDPKTENRVA